MGSGPPSLRLCCPSTVRDRLQGLTAESQVGLSGWRGVWARPSRPGAVGQSGGPDNKHLLLPVRPSTTGTEQKPQEVTLSALPAEAGNKSVKPPRSRQRSRRGANTQWEREGVQGTAEASLGCKRADTRDYLCLGHALSSGSRGLLPGREQVGQGGGSCSEVVQ